MELVPGSTDTTRASSKGRSCRSGASIEFKPTPVVGKPGPKFDPKAIPGIFLGYHVLPGGRWHGDYWVVPVSSFQGKENEMSKKVQLQRVKEVTHTHTLPQMSARSR